VPTYEYECKSCSERHEVVQSFGDEPLTVCPSCDGPLRKVFGAVGVVFKGSGFYKTDSRQSSKRSEAASSADGGSSSTDSGGPASSSDGAAKKGPADGAKSNGAKSGDKAGPTRAGSAAAAS
jgi:putative FmdB family regulatory protein